MSEKRKNIFARIKERMYNWGKGGVIISIGKYNRIIRLSENTSDRENAIQKLDQMASDLSHKEDDFAATTTLKDLATMLVLLADRIESKASEGAE